MNARTLIGATVTALFMSTAAFAQKMGGSEEASVKLQAEIITSCQRKGCWMDVKDPQTGDVLKVKVNDGDIVFPKSSTGRTAVMIVQ